MAKLQYSPLPFYGYIRLLSIDPDTRANEIRCHLHPARLDHCPRYDALSYVWGDAERSKQIFCNGQIIDIGENLFEALGMLRKRMARRTEKARKNRVGHTVKSLSHLVRRVSLEPYLIWIDKLCIDQNNNDERSDQVKLMRQIYHSAHQVIIWLGPAEPETELALSLVTKAAVRWKYHKDSETKIPGYRLLDASKLSPKGIKKPLRLPELQSSDWDSLERLFARPWFTRIWIIQEASVASSATVMIGEFEVRWEAVCEAGWLVSHVKKLFKYPYRDFHGADSGIILQSYQYHIKHEGVSLIKLLRDTRSFGATDARDKIFALLGLSLEGVDPKTHLLQPNYSASLLDVYQDATIGIIKKTKSLEILSQAVYSKSGRTEGFPSWVPRWDQSELGQSWSSQYEHYCASSGFPARYYAAADRRLLTLGGLPFDSIKAVSNVLWTPGWDVTPGVNMRINNPMWKIWASLIRPLGKYPTGEPIAEVFADTFMAGLGAHGAIQREAPRYQPSHVEYWLGLVRKESNVHGMASVLASELGCGPADLMLARRRNDLAPDTSFVSSDEYDSDIRHQNQETKFFTTERGYMGVGVRQIEVGDKICILFGNKVPIVLRDVEKGDMRGYELVGECVTHGIMQGEVVEKWGRNKCSPDPQKFVIF